MDFGMFVIVVSWLVVILLVVLFITGLHEKITAINWPLTVRLSVSLSLRIDLATPKCPKAMSQNDFHLLQKSSN